MKLKRKNKKEAEIPTTAMPDIVFMLIFFFMVSSVLRTSEGLQVNLPEAKKIQKLESRVHTAYIWVNKAKLIYIDGKPMAINSIRNKMYEKVMNDPELTVSLRADVKVYMELINQIHEELRQGNARKINYSCRAT